MRLHELSREVKNNIRTIMIKKIKVVKILELHREKKCLMKNAQKIDFGPS